MWSFIRFLLRVPLKQWYIYYAGEHRLIMHLALLHFSLLSLCFHTVRQQEGRQTKNFAPTRRNGSSFGALHCLRRLRKWLERLQNSDSHWLTRFVWEMKTMINLSALSLLPCCMTKWTHRTGLFDVSYIVRKRRLDLFGHVARLRRDVPANQILQICNKSRDGERPSQEWRRACGRPSTTWTHPWNPV